MAEFDEVFTQMKRMCKANNECCAMCDLSGKCPANEIVENYDACEIEKIVMQWAAEHPVVYPTWGEYLASIGVMKPAEPDKAYEVWFTQLYSTNIPDDIAQKLGVEPKEG